MSDTQEDTGYKPIKRVNKRVSIADYGKKARLAKIKKQTLSDLKGLFK